MKRFFLPLIAGLLSLATQAQETHQVIFDQPDGILTMYERQGSELVEQEETQTFNVRAQSGFMNVVVNDRNEVFLQDPVSGYTMGGSWVKGQLSDDGTTITLPLGQLVDYTRSFDLGYQLEVLVYDKDTNTYVVDEATTEVTYTLTNGAIVLNGTSQERILGLIIRAFGNPQGAAIGQNFSYLEGEWLGFGDFDSRYVRSEIQAQQPPGDMEAADYYLTTASFDGEQYAPYAAWVKMGYVEDTESIWIQGITRFLPSAWCKGLRDGDAVTIASGQYLGTVEGIPLYLHGALLDKDGNFTIKDIELTIEDDACYTYDYIFISTSETALEYITFYMGATLAGGPDEPVTLPRRLPAVPYTMRYQELNSLNRLTNGSRNVQVALDDDNIYVQGLWGGLPDAWVKGTVQGNRVTFSLPQYLGTFTSDDTDYPIYVSAFNEQTGQLYRQITFGYDAADLSLSSPSAAICIGINKTGYLSVQDYYNCSLTTNAMQGIEPAATAARGAVPALRYNLRGQRVAGGRGAVIVDGRKVLVGH